MCCFSGPVEQVENTRIFARLSGQGTQYLAYQMTYQARQPVAMILPLPVALTAREDAVRFVDLKEYPQFFEDLHKGFPAPQPISFMRSKGEAQTSAAAPLAVQTVGDFVASFVPTLADFVRLDPRFVLPRSTWDHLPQYRDYGFAVFQLRGPLGQNATPHPMAFEFLTRHLRSVFFPTVHIHDGRIHDTEHFDHALYMQGTGPHGDLSEGKAERYMDTQRASGLIIPTEPCRRVKMQGDFPNRDVVLSTMGDYTKPAIAVGLFAAAAYALGRRLPRSTILMQNRNSPGPTKNTEAEEPSP